MSEAPPQLVLAMRQLEQRSKSVGLTRLQMLALLGARVSRPALTFSMTHPSAPDA